MTLNDPEGHFSSCVKALPIQCFRKIALRTHRISRTYGYKRLEVTHDIQLSLTFSTDHVSKSVCTKLCRAVCERQLSFLVFICQPQNKNTANAMS